MMRWPRASSADGDAELADRQRKRRARQSRRAHRPDPMACFEQAADDTRLDGGVRAEDDDQVAAGSTTVCAWMSGRRSPVNTTPQLRRYPHVRPSAGSSSCRRAGGVRRRRRSTSRRTRSRSSSDGRSRVLARQSAPSRRVAEAVVGAVHRLADAVGEEQRTGRRRRAAIVCSSSSRSNSSPRRRCFSPSTIPSGASDLRRSRAASGPARRSAACGRRARRSSCRAPGR